MFKTEYARMYKAAFLLLHDDEEARDAVSDVFAQIACRQIEVAEETQSQFLLICVRNRCLNIIKSSTQQAAISEGNVVTAPNERDNDEELLSRIHAYMEHRLTQQTSRVVRMHYTEGKTYQEIGRELGISVATVNKHIVKALRKLRENFKTNSHE